MTIHPKRWTTYVSQPSEPLIRPHYLWTRGVLTLAVVLQGRPAADETEQRWSLALIFRTRSPLPRNRRRVWRHRRVWLMPLSEWETKS